MNVLELKVVYGGECLREDSSAIATLRSASVMIYMQYMQLSWIASHQSMHMDNQLISLGFNDISNAESRSMPR